MSGEFVTMVVDGQALQGWQATHVVWSFTAGVIEFELEAANPSWSYGASQLRSSKVLEIYTTPDGEYGRFGGGDLLMTGYVDEYEAQNGPGANRRVTVRGRSKSADSVDSAPVEHKTGYVENKDLQGVAEEFNEWPFTFRKDVQLDRIPLVQSVPGEPLFKTLEREARRQGVFLMGQPDGDMLITRGAKGRASGGLVEGQSPLESFRVVDQQRLAYSMSVVRGQESTGTDERNMRQEERAYDQNYGRKRSILLFNEGSNATRELKKRAEWELLRRNMARLQFHARVASWRDGAGALWKPQARLAVQAPSEAIDLDLAIHTVAFHQVVGEGEGCGTWADLILVYPEYLGENQ